MNTQTPDDRDPVDVFVGARVRTLRKLRHMSQQELAGNLGVSFQQVQKYEKATNRISASMLYRIAALYGLPISALFDGLPATTNHADAQARKVLDGAPGLDALINTGGGLSLAEAFVRIPAMMRGPLIDIARTMARTAPALAAAAQTREGDLTLRAVPAPQPDQASVKGPISPRSKLAVSAES